MNCLIIGGTPGLGLSLAKLLSKDYTVYITGRRDSKHTSLHFCKLDLSKRAGAFANSLSLDPRVKKTLVAGPAGIATNFWHGTDKKQHDTSRMLSPDWVAKAIDQLRKGDYTYAFARILREPARIELQEIRY